MWERRELYVQKNLDQSEGRLTARMPRVELEIVAAAIAERADRAPVNPETGVFDSYPARMADGLVELCASSGDTTTRRSAQVTIHADLQTPGRNHRWGRRIRNRSGHHQPDHATTRL